MESGAPRPQNDEAQQKTMRVPLTLRKARRLWLRRDIQSLFAKGNSSTAIFPVRAVWKWTESNTAIPFKVMVSVSKRHLSHAVDRNRAKRQMREAFRLNQEHLATTPGQTLHLAFIWLSDTPHPSFKVQRAVQQLMNQISPPDEISSQV